MITRITKSLTIAIRAAVLGFEKAYLDGESLDSILGFTDTVTGIPNRKAFERDVLLLTFGSYALFSCSAVKEEGVSVPKSPVDRVMKNHTKGLHNRHFESALVVTEWQWAA